MTGARESAVSKVKKRYNKNFLKQISGQRKHLHTANTMKAQGKTSVSSNTMSTQAAGSMSMNQKKRICVHVDLAARQNQRLPAGIQQITNFLVVNFHIRDFNFEGLTVFCLVLNALK